MPINFSAISSKRAIGKLLRLPLMLIPVGTQVRIVQGKMRGVKWITGSGNHGYWLGSYEYEKQASFSEKIRPGNIVYDIGANVGFYTILASRLVGKAGHVYAFEPAPENMAFLQKHLAINSIRNVTTFDCAVTNSVGTISFEEGSNRFLGHVSPRGNIVVKATSLDHLFLNSEILLPNVIKMDIEGTELDALRGAEKVLEQCAPIIFLATHEKNNPGVHLACCEYLVSKGFQLFPLQKDASIKETDELIAVPKDR